MRKHGGPTKMHQKPSLFALEPPAPARSRRTGFRTPNA